MKNYDLIIIGAGPGGSDLAKLACALKMQVALIEKDILGGTCLNRGCIPTKALLHFSEQHHSLLNLLEDELFSEALLEEKNNLWTYDKLLQFRDKVVNSQRNGLRASLEKNKYLDIYYDTAQVVADKQVQLLNSGEILQAEKLVIATGSTPAIPPIPGSDSPHVLNSDLLLDERAKQDYWDFSSIIIVGGGVIGVEFADLFRSQGKEVTIIEALDNLVSNMDSQLSKGLEQVFKKNGINVLLKSLVQEISVKDNGLELIYKNKKSEKTESLFADKVLLATGRKANTKNLFASTINIEMEKSNIRVNKYFQTSIPSIYAIGDVRSGTLQLAHEASNDAMRLMHYWQHAVLLDAPVIPKCVYTHPELAETGVNEKTAKAQGIAYISAKASTLANARNLISGGNRGFVNLVFSQDTRQLIGAQWMGDRATELIDSLSLAIQEKMTVDTLIEWCHPHPSFAESINQAVYVAKSKLED